MEYREKTYISLAGAAIQIQARLPLLCNTNTKICHSTSHISSARCAYTQTFGRNDKLKNLVLLHNQKTPHPHPHTHTCNMRHVYLERVLCVVQAVDSDVILHGGAGDRAEDGQLEALGGGSAESLAHEAVGAQRLCQDVAGLVIHLDVARRGEILFAYHDYILQYGRKEKSKCG